MSAIAGERAGRRARVAAALGVLALAALAARVVPALPVVLPRPEAVRLLGADAYYHVRQARRVLDHFPAIERRDVESRYPSGDRAASAGLFAVGVAAGARVLGGSDDAARWIEPVAAWLPPLLAVAALLALFALARPWLGAAGALLAGALFVLHPGPSLPLTLLGAADHHAAEIPLALLACAGVSRCVRRSLAFAPSRWRPALLEAFPLALFAFTWLGAPIHVAIAGLALAALTLAEVSRDVARPRSPDAALRLALGLAIWVLAAAAVAPWLVMSRPLFAALLGACAALALGPHLVAAAARALMLRGAGPATAACSVAAFGAAGLGLCVAVLPPLRALLAPRTAWVAEHRDLSALDVGVLFGACAPLALLAAAVAIVRLLRGSAPLDALVPVASGGLLAALALRVDDYAYVVAPFVSLGAAAAVVAVAGRRRFAAAALALLVAAPVWPLGWTWAPWPDRAQVREMVLVHDGWHEALGWLVRETPDGVGYGVAAAWEYGHAVAALGRRPPVWSHGFSPAEAAFWLAPDEPTALARLCPACREGERVRYVIADARTLGAGLRARERALGRDGALRVDGSFANADGRRVARAVAGSERSLPARLLLDGAHGLERLRLVHASAHESCLFTRARAVTAVATRVERVTIPIESDRERARCDALATRGSAPIDGAWLYDARRVPSVAIFEVSDPAVLRATTREEPRR